MQKLLDSLSEEIQDYYNHVDTIPLIPSIDISEIHEHLNNQYNFQKPLALEEINSDVQKMMRRWTLHNSHPHYMGLFVPAALLPSIIADTYTALYNPQLGAWSHAPGANEIERHVLKHLMKKFGLNPEIGWANFTTGGTEANLSAVLAALTKSFPEYGEKGLQALKGMPVFYVSEEAHHSFNKIGQITGLGNQAVRNIRTDKEFSLDLDELKRQYIEDTNNGYLPFMVAATAGTTSGGVIDPLLELAEFCRKNNLWFHVDAAYGGAAVMSEKTKHLLNGIENADSITCDAHKWFSVSMSAGMFFCRDKKAVLDTFHSGAAYLPESGKNTFDAFSTTLQCSRRFIGLKLFMTLANMGDAGYAGMIEKQIELGHYLRKQLIQAGFTIVNKTELPVICFTHKNIANGTVKISEILDSIYARKNFWISQTKLGKKTRVLRACTTSFRTEVRDIDEFVNEISQSLKNPTEVKAALK